MKRCDVNVETACLGLDLFIGLAAAATSAQQSFDFIIGLCSPFYRRAILASHISVDSEMEEEE